MFLRFFQKNFQRWLRNPFSKSFRNYRNGFLLKILSNRWSSCREIRQSQGRYLFSTTCANASVREKAESSPGIYNAVVRRHLHWRVEIFFLLDWIFNWVNFHQVFLTVFFFLFFSFLILVSHLVHVYRWLPRQQPAPCVDFFFGSWNKDTFTSLKYVYLLFDHQGFLVIIIGWLRKVVHVVTVILHVNL